MRPLHHFQGDGMYATYIGPRRTFSFAGCQFEAGVERPVPAATFTAAKGHPEFTVRKVRSNAKDAN